MGNLKFESYFEVLYPLYVVDSLKTLKVYPTIDLVGDNICDLNFKRTENHNFTITTNMSQHVEFFYSLIFSILSQGLFNF